MARLAFGILFAVVLLPVVAFAAFWGYLHFVQSPSYAGLYFDDLTKIERVEASRRWHWGAHPWGGSAFGCSFAIATLPPDAPEQPPERGGQRSFPMNWPATVEWKESPVVISDGQHEVLKECAYALPQNLAIRLQTAHDAPGSLYVASLEYLFLYSTHHRIIARIRFGD